MTLQVVAVDLENEANSTAWLELLDHYARDPMGGKDRLCTHCVIVFVALDESGKPRLQPAPPAVACSRPPATAPGLKTRVPAWWATA